MKLISPNNMKTPACRSIRGQLVKKLILLKKQRNGNIDRSFVQRDLNYRLLLSFSETAKFFDSLNPRMPKHTGV